MHFILYRSTKFTIFFRDRLTKFAIYFDDRSSIFAFFFSNHSEFQDSAPADLLQEFAILFPKAFDEFRNIFPRSFEKICNFLRGFFLNLFFSKTKCRIFYRDHLTNFAFFRGNSTNFVIFFLINWQIWYFSPRPIVEIRDIFLPLIDKSAIYFFDHLTKLTIFCVIALRISRYFRSFGEF